MSFLAWAFGLGALAVGFPLLFHLIRRTPRGQQPFSSLMFLTPSPPRLTRRSRLDQWLLLLLRIAAIALLALAFMRPFFRQTAVFDLTTAPGRRVAIVLDISASMRRGDLWTQAVSQVKRVLDGLDRADDVALFTFDRTVHNLVEFNTRDAATELEQKKAVVWDALKKQSPGWLETNLAGALMTVADQLSAAADLEQNKATLQIVLVSDSQSGSETDRLQAYQWPGGVRVDLRTVSTPNRSNATLRLLADSSQSESAISQRVRVTNGATSAADQFFVQWSDSPATGRSEQATPFYVPPGTSRILEVPRGESNLRADRLVLFGDETDFDNQFFAVPPQRRQSQIVYLGDESPDDADHMLYYLQRAFPDTAAQQVKFEQFKSDSDVTWPDVDPPDLVVVTGTITRRSAMWLRQYADVGGTVFVVLDDQPQADSLEELIGPLKIESRSESGSADSQTTEKYALLADLDFSHPLLAPFALPQFNDFTKIHFWNSVAAKFDEDQAHIIARFDNGVSALWEMKRPRGAVYCLASSWSPAASQLALSSKFVPLMNILLESSRRHVSVAGSYVVGEPVSLPAPKQSESMTVQRPDGSQQVLPATQAQFLDTEQPGVYAVAIDGETIRFAVNLSPSESDITPMSSERLRALGVALGTQTPRSERIEQLQRLKDVEVERRQKVWKWLLVATIGLLLVETTIAGSNRANKTEPRQQLGE